jgi:hypothetical protein
VNANKEGDWSAKMTEPLVIKAGLEYLAGQGEHILTNQLAEELFAPLKAMDRTSQERGTIMEQIIALEFMQKWWLKPELEQFLPMWAKKLSIPTPKGILDCRPKESGANSFVQQLLNPEFNYVLLPSVFAKPDLRYSIFCCYVKTTSTANSKSSMYVSPQESRKNIDTMDPNNWYQSDSDSPQNAQIARECAEVISQKRRNGDKFIHIRFELPYPASSMRPGFKDTPIDDNDSDCTICVDLDSEFARLFFGESFIKKYKEFVERLQNAFKN